MDLIFTEQDTSFSVRLFETSYHSVRELSQSDEILLSDTSFDAFLGQYSSFGAGHQADTNHPSGTGFWWGRPKVYADQVQVQCHPLWPIAVRPVDTNAQY